MLTSVKAKREPPRRESVQDQVCPPFRRVLTDKRCCVGPQEGLCEPRNRPRCFPPLLGRPSQARPHRQPRRLRADCGPPRRATARWRVKVDDGGSPAEAATTPGVPNPPWRDPQAGIPITFLSPRTIPSSAVELLVAPHNGDLRGFTSYRCSA